MNVLLKNTTERVVLSTRMKKIQEMQFWQGDPGFFGLDLFWYYPSTFYLINYYKNIQNIKNCMLRPPPPGGGGVWCDTPVPNVRTIHQMSLLYIINMEVPAPGDSLFWDGHCDITTQQNKTSALKDFWDKPRHPRNPETWKNWSSTLDQIDLDLHSAASIKSRI